MNTFSEITNAKYAINEILEFSTAKAKHNLHLTDFGTIQIPNFNINNEKHVLYVWLLDKNDNLVKRYVLKPHQTKLKATNINKSDIILNQYKFQYNWCESSHIICISEYISGPLKVISKKMYYTIYLAIPYFIKISDISILNKNLRNSLYLIDVMKFIFGIPSKYSDNGFYIVKNLNKLELRVCSFNNGQLMTNLGSFKNDLQIKLQSLKDERDWLLKLSESIDKIYYIRLCELLSSN